LISISKSKQQSKKENFSKLNEKNTKAHFRRRNVDNVLKNNKTQLQWYKPPFSAKVAHMKMGYLPHYWISDPS